MTEQTGLIDVVIVNWNAGTQLAACLASLEKYGAPHVAKIIVVDNGSSDGSVDVAEGKPGVVLLRARDNLGFAKACNMGAGLATAELVLFLNPDAAIFPETLKTVSAFISGGNTSEAIGICGVQLLDETQRIARTCARFPTATSLVFHAIGLDRLMPKIGHFMFDWEHDQTREVDHVIGAFYLVRRSLFIVLHGFDEHFFVYLEDLDFSRRAAALGWRCAFLSSAQAFHAGGGTSHQVKARRLFYVLRSRLIYARKHFSVFGHVSVLLATVFLEPVSRTVLAIARGSWPNLRETWQAYVLLLRWLPRWWVKGECR